MTFRRFVAVDWSGAKSGGRDGIAVAQCGPGSTSPCLVAGPQRGRWRRPDVVQWLSERIKDGGRTLVGLDFAFAFPWNEPGGYFPGLAAAPDDARALWRLVEERTTGAPDLYAGEFIDDQIFRRYFWTRKPPSAHRCPGVRATERRCREQHLGSPETIFKLVGPKQIGKASLSGMRAMHRLKAVHGDALAVWPFESIRNSAMVCVEIFPRLFLTRAGMPVKKVRGPDEVNRALAHFASDPLAVARRMFTDHETDAMISAAGLRALSADRALWAPKAMNKHGGSREGWIFGVD